MVTEKDLGERIVIVCPNEDCGQKLGIPETTGTLRVTCPKCRTSFIYPARPGHKRITRWLFNKAKRHPIFLGLTLTFWFLLVVNRYLRGTLTLGTSFLVTGACICLWLFGTWVMDKLREERTKWYYRKWFVVLMLFVFAPVGITLLWAGARFRRPTKIGLTIAFGLWFLGGILTQSPERFPYWPRDEIAELISSYRGNIFLESASHYAKTSFRNEILGKQTSPVTVTLTIPQIAKEWGESIVLVKSRDKNGNELSQGSAFVISRNGAIVTNYHVLELAYDVSIEFVGGESYHKVFLIAAYPSEDIAILHIGRENETYSPVVLGNSDDLEVGQDVVAIGNPYGWQNTVSAGLISGVRDIDGFSLLQITAPISPGSSGGALFNVKGEVIGITTIGSQWGAQNLNFAIPINTLKSRIAEEFYRDSRNQEGVE